MTNKLIYFDNAATGYPKPSCVIKETKRAFLEYGGNPGRSGHSLSVAASRAVYSCREAVCSLINCSLPERVVFTPNATYALNLAIKGMAQKNSHILLSDLEHNSVIRPVHALSKAEGLGIEYSFFSAVPEDDSAVLKNFAKAIRKDTKMAVITAASNICGKKLPLEAISKLCKERGIKLVIDAAQGCGEMEIDFSEISPDALCSAGHKGLYGPTGTGFAVFGESAEPSAFIQGGNGTMSEIADMTGELPERLEAGTLNTFGICGLSAGIGFIKKLGIKENEEKLHELADYITEGLLNAGAVVYGDYKNKTPIVLFNIPGKASSEVSSFLDSYSICTRSGLHCAPTAHKALGTGDSGAVRVSLGYANTKAEAIRFLDVVNRIKKGT